MKKLMIALAAVALATVTQAASIDWSATVASGLSSTDPAYAGYTVYLCKSLADGGFESEDAIGEYLYGTIDNSGSTIKKGSRSPYKYQVIATARGIADADVGMQTVYAVIVSKDGKGYWTTSAQGEVYTTAEKPVEAAFDATTLITTSYTPWKTGPGPDPTPEPTTGLLMLVGLAGLALKRKVA